MSQSHRPAPPSTAALPGARDKLLFTPGPLTTSPTVKQAMLRDLGSRDEDFLAAVREVRERLLGAYGLSQGNGWEAIPLQGSGTYAVEAGISSIVPRGAGKLLALVNGAYGERIVKMAAVHGIPCEVLRAGEDTPIDPAAVRAALAKDRVLTHVVLVHVETTSGVLNPLRAIGAEVRAAQRVFFVDAMSSFGALPIEFEDAGVAFLAASANKCLEGIPGLAFVLARRSALERIEGQARTLTLDLHAQWRALEKDGQFRFTPPTHTLLALRQALLELELEGGVPARGARYRTNHERLRGGMEALGFRAYVPKEHASPIISTFLYPRHAKFAFPDFYRRLSARGFLIYPGKLTQADCFRVGNIGHLFPRDVDALLAAVPLVLREMGVELGPEREPGPETVAGPERSSAWRFSMPEISRFLGIVVQMYFEDHLPPHFHARYGEFRIKVFIQNGIVEGRFPPRALRHLMEWYDLHRAELQQDWVLASHGQDPLPIAPLE